jgi:hypothetical protein
LALLPVLAGHWMALALLPTHAQMVNRIVGVLLQVAGGLLILYSINDNLGLFRRQSLLSAAITWFKSVPRKGTNVTLNIDSASHAHISGTASLTPRSGPTSLDERVEYLEATLSKLRQDVAEGLANTQRQIEGSKAELTKRADRTDGQIFELSRQVEQAAVGGFKLQGFGVALAVYGALTSVFA